MGKATSAFRKLVVTVSAALMILGPPARAAIPADEAGHARSLNALVEELVRRNPQLEQTHQTYLAAKAQAIQARALPGAQLSLIEQANTGGPFDFNRRSDFFAYYTVTQPLLWPGKLRLQGQIADSQADYAQTQYQATLLQLIVALKMGFYQLLALQDQQRFMQEDAQRLHEIKELARARYANNAIAYVDYLNAQVAESSLDNDQFGLGRQIQAITEQINTLIGHESQDPLSLEVPEIHPHLPAASPEEFVQKALAVNPTVLGSGFLLAGANKSVDLAQKAFFPDFQILAGIYSDPSLVQLQTSRMYSIGVNIQLPTWGFRKEAAGLASAQAQAEAAKDNDQATRAQVELSVVNAFHALETSLRQSQFTRDRLLPQAQLAYRIAVTAYSSGGVMAFTDLLTAQSGLRSTELDLVQSDNSAMQAYVNLMAAVGRDPD